MTSRDRFVGDFAAALTDAGMQRMAARVFSTLLIAPDDGLTAGEIGDTLSVSTGAVSGATSYLVRTGLAERRVVDGERAHRYLVTGTSWAEAIATETATVRTLADVLRRGSEAVDDPVAAHRLDETRDFFEFLEVELPRLAARWHAERERGAR